MDILSDKYFMKEALKEAQKAFDEGEVPIGAVIVSKGIIIGKGHNQTERLNDVTAHAEMMALSAAASTLGGKYLKECTLYVTIEPCVMCAGALGWAQISKVVFGAVDEKRGYSQISPKAFHPKTDIVGGVEGDECAKMMRLFFEDKR